MSSLASRNNLIGVGSLVLGIFVFSIQDTIIKSISGAHAVTLAIFLRSIVSFPILLAMVHFETGLQGVISPRWPLLFARGAILLSAYICYYIAFAALPLAEAIALFFVAPLMVTIMSGPLLGEKVTPWTWAAVAIGLVGVFVILRPGYGIFEPAALLSLIAAGAYAYAMILARKHAKDIPTTVMSFYQNVTYIVCSLVFSVLVNVIGIEPPSHPSLAFLFRPWDWPNAWDLSLMAACGVIAAFAATLLSHAYRTGAASVVTPFEYTGMMWGTIWGIVLFNEVPRATTLIGMAMIAAAGVLALQAGTSKRTAKQQDPLP